LSVSRCARSDQQRHADNKRHQHSSCDVAFHSALPFRLQRFGQFVWKMCW
jgi:hypothetical protein